MKEITCLIDKVTGQLTVEGLPSNEVAALTNDLLSKPQAVNCAKPINAPPLTITRTKQSLREPTLRVYRIYHNSVVEGPGRRSVIQLQGCTRYCEGCYATETFDVNGGAQLTISEAARLLLDKEGEPRDGITVLGGEPFLQPEGLADLLHALKDCEQHITLYTGYTLEELLALKDKSVTEALALTDILIDGPFVVSLTQGAEEWRGSANQGIIYKAEIDRALKANF